MGGSLVVAPVVEGHGEESAARVLFPRIGTELLGLDFVQVCRPVRKPRSALVSERSAQLEQAVGIAALQLDAGRRAIPGEPPGLVLILVDANGDCPAELGPALLERSRAFRSDTPIRVALAVAEFETWFVAAAESLGDFLKLAEGEAARETPEETGQRKKWVEDRYAGNGTKYSETVDQARMTAAMDLVVVRDRCPSFTRLCRILVEAARPASDEEE